MQQRWDSLDKSIKSSLEEIKADNMYNQRLLEKLNNKKSLSRNNLVSAFSLIMAGLILITVYTTDIKYRMIDLELQIKYELSGFENKINLNKNMFGEW